MMPLSVVVWFFWLAASGVSSQWRESTVSTSYFYLSTTYLDNYAERDDAICSTLPNSRGSHSSVGRSGAFETRM